MKKLKFGIIAGLCLIVLAYATMMSHSEVLVSAQDRNVFVEGWDAFAALTAMHPFGLIEWLGSWMTQLFYWPAFGMTMVILFYCTGMHEASMLMKNSLRKSCSS